MFEVGDTVKVGDRYGDVFDIQYTNKVKLFFVVFTDGEQRWVKESKLELVAKS